MLRLSIRGGMLGNNVAVRPGCHLYVDKGAQLSLGEATEIGRGSTITASHLIVLGPGVLTGPNVFISDHNHEYKDPFRHIYLQGIRMHPDDSVIIGEGTWIGTNAVIVGNVRIGKQCVIGANSVITHDIPDYSVAAGIPAKVIKQYNFEKRCWQTI